MQPFGIAKQNNGIDMINILGNYVRLYSCEEQRQEGGQDGRTLGKIDRKEIEEKRKKKWEGLLPSGQNNIYKMNDMLMSCLTFSVIGCKIIGFLILIIPTLLSTSQKIRSEADRLKKRSLSHTPSLQGLQQLNRNKATVSQCSFAHRISIPSFKVRSARVILFMVMRTIHQNSTKWRLGESPSKGGEGEEETKYQILIAWRYDQTSITQSAL